MEHFQFFYYFGDKYIKTIVNIVVTGYSELAYDHIKNKEALPSEEIIAETLQDSTDFNKMGNKFNNAYLECSRKTLLEIEGMDTYLYKQLLTQAIIEVIRHIF